MKHEQMLQAEALYMQTSLAKTEIADNLGISRTTLYTWAQENDWDRLKSNARNMPTLMAENMYILLGHKLNSVLAAYSNGKIVPLNDLSMICKLTNAAHKHTNRSTINETMELRMHFIDYVKAHEPAMVAAVQPLIDGFIRSLARTKPTKPVITPLHEKTQTETKAVNETELLQAINDIKARSQNIPAGQQAVNITEQPEDLGAINKFLDLAEQYMAERSEITCTPAPEPQIPKPSINNTSNLNRAQRRELERIAKKKNQQKQAA